MISLRSFTTLFVIIDIDKEIVDWMSQRSTREFSHCSWLIATQTNLTVTAHVNARIGSTEKDIISEQSSIFRSLRGKKIFTM